MRQIDVSVIVPVHNGMPYVHRALESVVSQTLGVDRIEVLVVDDGSTDGSGEAVDSWAERYPDLIRVVHAEKPSGGPAAPRNIGLDLATGRYVFFLDADDYLGTEALERLVAVADANGSDVVLGRMATTTGRGLPSSAFRTTDLDADLFNSHVYWTLSPQKLFRRDLLDQHQVRFQTRFPIISDQPFTALAYLRAGRISVLADYDYYFLEWRDDGKHVTRSGSVSDRLDVIEAMCDLVAAEVPDSARRTPLLTRHLQGDLWRVMRGIALLERSEQDPLVTRAAGLLKRFLSGDVMSRLTPDRRVVYELARRGLLDETLAAVAGTPEEFAPELLLEGENAFAVLPYFRDPVVALPDELYEANKWVRGEQSLASFAFDGTVLLVQGAAALRRVAQTPTLEILLRSSRKPVRQLVVPASVSDGGFSASVDLLTVADGAPLPSGRWTVVVQLTVEGVVRTLRLGTDAGDTVTPAVTAATLDTGEGWKVRAQTLAETGDLVLHVGGPAARLSAAYQDWSASWDGTDLVVGARAVARVGAPVALACANGDGDVRTSPVDVTGDRLSGRVAVGALPEGRWRVRLQIGAEPAPLRTPVPRRSGLAVTRWRRAFHVMEAAADVESEQLVLEVGTVGFADLVRRLRRRAALLIRRS